MLEQWLDEIFESEVVLTLLNVKPLSIIKAPLSSDKVIKELHKNGTWPNDLAYRLRFFQDHYILELGRKSLLKKFVKNDKDMFLAIDEFVDSLESKSEKDIFWGRVLGYPESDVQSYSSPQAEQRKKILKPVIPNWYSDRITYSYSTYEGNEIDSINFENIIDNSLKEFQKLRLKSTNQLECFKKIFSV